MATPARSTKLTYEDYLLFPDDGKRHEIIEGDHYVTPAPKTKHQRVLNNLSGLFYIYLQRTNAGRVFSAPTDVVLSEMDVVQPDLLFVSADRASIVTEDNIQGAPDIVVEILSDTTRRTDEVIKRKLYERYAVPEYWIVDPVLETIKIHRLSEQAYVRLAELGKEANDTLTTALLPDLHLPLTKIFE